MLSQHDGVVAEKVSFGKFKILKMKGQKVLFIYEKSQSHKVLSCLTSATRHRDDIR
jgi:hypothetical protein